MILTKDEEILLKKKNAIACRAKHQPYFDKANIPEAIFIPKCAWRMYKDDDDQDYYIACFENELSRGGDVYFEFTNVLNEPDKNIEGYIPEGLYKWAFNPFFKDEYNIYVNPKKSGLDNRYVIPLAELIYIDEKSFINPPPTPVKTNIEIPKSEDKVMLNSFYKAAEVLEDNPFSEATLRDIASLLLRTPTSNKIWLNNLINNCNNKK